MAGNKKLSESLSENCITLSGQNTGPIFYTPKNYNVVPILCFVTIQTYTEKNRSKIFNSNPRSISSSAVGNTFSMEVRLGKISRGRKSEYSSSQHRSM